MSVMKIRSVSLFVSLCVLAVSAWAQDAGQLRERLRSRIPQIDALKTQGAVGENNRGLLEVPPAGKGDAGSIVAEENRDREAVYALIAKETGATADAVGRARARKIAADSRPGVWIQDESGQWKKK